MSGNSGLFSLDWLVRDNQPKNHFLFGDQHFGIEAPSVMYELRPYKDRKGNPIDKLFVAWITLNNPRQYNSYTTPMVMGVIAGMQTASADPSVVAVIFTAVGDKAFCTGGNTREYAEYYALRPAEYGNYMDLFIAMVDAILHCKKPVINLINGMRVAGGQEIGMACDFSIATDLAILGQAGPRHGSAPDGGSTDFLSLFLPIEKAMDSCISCQMWSAYEMYRWGLITDVIPVLKDGETFVRNPMVITDTWLDDGRIVYGQIKTGDVFKAAKARADELTVDLSPLHRAGELKVWQITNTFPGCRIKSIDGIRQKKRTSWDTYKVVNRHWLAANQMSEGALGFAAFNSRKKTGKDVIDFVLLHQMLAEGHAFDDELAAAVMPKPTGIDG